MMVPSTAQHQLLGNVVLGRECRPEEGTIRIVTKILQRIHPPVTISVSFQSS